MHLPNRAILSHKASCPWLAMSKCRKAKAWLAVVTLFCFGKVGGSFSQMTAFSLCFFPSCCW